MVGLRRRAMNDALDMLCPDYLALKTAAKVLGCRVCDLLAMSEDTDPFFAGRPARLRAAEWFAAQWRKFSWGENLHVRRAHYVLCSVTPQVLLPGGGEPYLNTTECWKFLCSASMGARAHGLVGGFVDRRNPSPAIHTRSGGNPNHTWQASVSAFTPRFAQQTPTFLLPKIYPPGVHIDGFEPYSPWTVCVVCEKTTQNDILAPLSEKHGFDLVTGAGELSQTAARLLVDRAVARGKALHVIYISDHDPAGAAMPVSFARKIEYLIRNQQLDVEITLDQLCLTAEQVAEYELPRIPIKESERRARKFEERFGEGAVELDALEALRPGTLAKLVVEQVGRYLDPTLATRVQQAKTELWLGFYKTCHGKLAPYEPKFEEFRARYAAAAAAGAAAVAAVAAEYEQIDNDLAIVWSQAKHELEDGLPEGAQPGVPEARVRPVADPLFDSSRDYLEQLDFYHRHQGRLGDREKDSDS